MNLSEPGAGATGFLRLDDTLATTRVSALFQQMKHLLFAAAFCLLFASFVSAQSDEINIVPRPQSVKAGMGTFRLTRKTKIWAFSESGRRAAAILNDKLERSYGFRLKVTGGLQPSNSITLIRGFGLLDQPSREPYSISVVPDGIKISGTESGLFYGVQSFLQLLPTKFEKEITIPAVEIADTPRFSYRGMHLDVARHFIQ